MVLVALAAGALASVADEKEAADAEGDEDDDEAEDWNGDYRGQIQV